MAPMSNYGGVRTPNIESNEVQYPHITICHELETDTAGAGRWRGGAGIRYSLYFYDPRPGIVMFGDGMKNPPYGLNGGQPGSLNRAQLRTTDRTIPLRSKEDLRRLDSGDTIELVSSGGGGWGNPCERDPDKVFNDVIDGIVSPEMARNEYGVAIGPKGIDSEETRRLRRKRSADTIENK
jgi:N-methylhydantoinase B